MRSLTKNSIYNIAYKISSVLFSFVTVAYVSRILLPDGIGIVEYAQNIASYFIMVGSIGIPIYGIREVSIAQNDPEKESKVCSELIIITASLTIIAFASYLVMINCFPGYEKEKILWYVCGIQILLNGFNVDWAFQGREQYGYIAARSIIIKVISVIFVILFVRKKSDYIIYALISSIALAGNNVLGFFSLLHSVKFTCHGLNIKRHFDSLLALAALTFFGTIYNKIDVTMLGKMTDNFSVGLYSNAHKLVEIIITTCAAITATYMPKLSKLFFEDREKLIILINRGYRIICFFAIPASVGAFACAKQAIVIAYGSSFINAATTIRIFTLMILVRTFGDLFCYQLLIAGNMEKKRVFFSMIGSITNIVLNAILIPVLSFNGAAIASVISELVVNVSLYILIKKRLQLQMSIRPLAEAILSSLFMIVGIGGAMHIFNSETFVGMLFVILSGGSIYIASNVLLKNEVVLGFIYSFVHHAHLKKQSRSN